VTVPISYPLRNSSQMSWAIQPVENERGFGYLSLRKFPRGKRLAEFCPKLTLLLKFPIALFERHCHATEKSEASTCARRCRSSRLSRWHKGTRGYWPKITKQNTLLPKFNKLEQNICLSCVLLKIRTCQGSLSPIKRHSKKYVCACRPFAYLVQELEQIQLLEQTVFWEICLPKSTICSAQLLEQTAIEEIYRAKYVDNELEETQELEQTRVRTNAF
jgi:hypothetical protein